MKSYNKIQSLPARVGGGGVGDNTQVTFTLSAVAQTIMLCDKLHDVVAVLPEHNRIVQH